MLISHSTPSGSVLVFCGIIISELKNFILLQMKTCTTNGFRMLLCPYCNKETRHGINFKCFGFDTSVQKQNVAFYSTCTVCPQERNTLIVLLREDYDALKISNPQ